VSIQDWPTLLIGAKLLLAMLCGGAIGLERELSHKAAGLRTNVLICIGAALYMIVSRHISGGAPYTDPARLAAQVVAGIGFLGAGVILQSRGSVIGLTTAATIFLVGAVGIAIGEGLFGLAAFTTLLVIVVLVMLRKFESALIKRQRIFHYVLTTRDPSQSLDQAMQVLEKERVHLQDYTIKDLPDGTHEVKLSVLTSIDGSRRLLQALPRSDARAFTEKRRD
jgi:putative Mg2+ transporter-C (MgtC) family protein